MIIVTGSESFVGKELIAQCLKEGIEVFGFDFLKKSDIPYEFKKGDITDPNVGSIFPEGADAIVHLAAISRPKECAGKAYETFTTNVMGTLNVMRAAKTKGVKQFIFASSEWVYEPSMGGEERDEEASINVAKHTTEYALSKLVSEANLRVEYLRGDFMPVTILRFGIIYGPRKINWSAVEGVASDTKNNDTVALMGSRRTGRRYIHVSDIAKGIRSAFGRNDFQIINLAGGKFLTLEDVIKETEKLLNKKVAIVEPHPEDVNVRNVSIKKAKELLGWEPETDLAAGLKTILPFI